MTDKSTFSQKEHLLLVEDDKGKQEILLKHPVYSLGRAPNCDIRLRSQFVSRHHATLFRFERGNNSSYYRIVDGDAEGKASANGMLINGRKVAVYDLQDGDKVIFAPQVVAIYHYRQREEFASAPYNDPFDITLINPAMMDSDGEVKDSNSP